MWFISKPIAILFCGSTNGKMIHSDVVPPILGAGPYRQYLNFSGLRFLESMDSFLCIPLQYSSAIFVHHGEKSISDLR